MNLGEKMPYARQSIRSISRHMDEDGAVRKALLDDLVSFIEGQKTLIDEELADKIAGALAPPPAEPDPPEVVEGEEGGGE